MPLLLLRTIASTVRLCVLYFVQTYHTNNHIAPTHLADGKASLDPLRSVQFSSDHTGTTSRTTTLTTSGIWSIVRLRQCVVLALSSRRVNKSRGAKFVWLVAGSNARLFDNISKNHFALQLDISQVAKGIRGVQVVHSQVNFGQNSTNYYVFSKKQQFLKGVKHRLATANQNKTRARITATLHFSFVVLMRTMGVW